MNGRGRDARGATTHLEAAAVEEVVLVFCREAPALLQVRLVPRVRKIVDVARAQVRCRAGVVGVQRGGREEFRNVGGRLAVRPHDVDHIGEAKDRVFWCWLGARGGRWRLRAGGLLCLRAGYLAPGVVCAAAALPYSSAQCSAQRRIKQRGRQRRALGSAFGHVSPLAPGVTAKGARFLKHARRRSKRFKAENTV